ncbi:MAG: hypothetical protein KAR21_02410 [Spirochaetales bacterium]|nr:hypothetical protein [Spirochaetales bacterium]
MKQRIIFFGKFTLLMVIVIAIISILTGCTDPSSPSSDINDQYQISFSYDGEEIILTKGMWADTTDTSYGYITTNSVTGMTVYKFYASEYNDNSSDIATRSQSIQFGLTVDNAGNLTDISIVYIPQAGTLYMFHLTDNLDQVTFDIGSDVGGDWTVNIPITIPANGNTHTLSEVSGTVLHIDDPTI